MCFGLGLAELYVLPETSFDRTLLLCLKLIVAFQFILGLSWLLIDSLIGLMDLLVCYLGYYAIYKQDVVNLNMLINYIFLSIMLFLSSGFAIVAVYTNTIKLHFHKAWETLFYEIGLCTRCSLFLVGFIVSVLLYNRLREICNTSGVGQQLPNNDDPNIRTPLLPAQHYLQPVPPTPGSAYQQRFPGQGRKLGE